MHMQHSTIPSSMQGIFWTQNIHTLDLENDKAYIIHHTLRYGKIQDIAWLLRVYPKNIIVTTFLSSPFPIYSPPSLHFVKESILHIPGELAHEHKYIQSLS